MDLRGYDQHKLALAELLRGVTSIAPDTSQWRERMAGLFARLAEDRFNLVVVGRFSRGKSSLMNAILGTDRLPTGIVPLTSVITSVAYGSTERVLLRYEDRFSPHEISIADLPKYVTQQANPGNIKGLKEAEVQLPAEFLRRGFHFVDTPGLGSAIEENTRTTESYLPEADAFLLVTSFESPLTEDELRFFRFASSRPRRIFVIVNKQDLASEAQRAEALDYVRRTLERTFGRDAPSVFSISARDALEARQANDAERLKASGLLALETELVHFLLTAKQAEFLLRMCDRALETIDALPATEKTVDLKERIRESARAIAKDNPDATVGVEPTLAIPRAAQFRACEICAAMTSASWEFLRHFQYDITVDDKVRGALAERGGLCSFHTWQYEANASLQGVCQGFSAVLKSWADFLRSQSERPEMEPLAHRLPNEASCPMCRVRAEAELRAVRALARQFAVEEERAFDNLSSLCLPHLSTLVEEIHDDRIVRRLFDRQAWLLERLAEDMDRYALKRDAIRGRLLTGDEDIAGKRGLALLARNKTIADRVG